MAFTMRVLVAVSALGLIALGMPVRADETGFASTHDQVRVGSKKCFADHFHYGSSAGMGSRRAAEIEAVKSWESFTDFEYGSDWARYSKAVSKGVKCGQSGGGWGCSVEARPCR